MTVNIPIFRQCTEFTLQSSCDKLCKEEKCSYCLHEEQSSSLLFWDVVLLHLMTGYQCFDTRQWPHLQGSKCTFFNDTVSDHSVTQCHILEEQTTPNCTSSKVYKLIRKISLEKLSLSWSRNFLTFTEHKAELQALPDLCNSYVLEGPAQVKIEYKYVKLKLKHSGT